MGDELAVEDRDPAVEQERRGLEPGHRCGLLGEPAGQIPTVPADEPTRDCTRLSPESHVQRRGASHTLKSYAKV